jgi:hypothetical protein
MLPFSKRAHEGGKRRRGLMLGVAVTLAFVACSKKQSGTGPTFDTGPSVSSVVTTTWGAAEGQLGHNVPEEGLPEGPKSFAVDAHSIIHVLDQENGRIQKFKGGASAGVVALPTRPFDDIELDGKGYVLLDAHSEPALVFVDATGNVTNEVPLAGDEIPEPSLITAIVRNGDGLYVEIEDDYLVHVTDASGAAVEQSVVPGQAIDGSAAMKIESVDDKRVGLFRIGLPDGEPTPLTELSFTERVAERSLFAPAGGGGLLLAVRLEQEQLDPETPPVSQSALVVLEPNGTERHRVDLPQSDAVDDVFRSVRRGDDGNVYVMKISDAGVELVKVKP